MDEFRIKITLPNGNMVTAIVPSNAPIVKLLPALVRKLGLPDGNYKCYHRKSGRNLSDNDTLESAGVLSEDSIVLLQDVIAGGFMPIRKFSDLRITDTVLLMLENKNAATLGAIFLYTEWDLSLAEFIRENIGEIDKLAGGHCNVFIIEEPTTKWLEKNKVDLSDEKNLQSFLWSRLDWSSAKPYDKDEAIEIARHFKIEPDALPCIALFNSGTPNEYILLRLDSIIPAVSENIQEDYKRFFRKLFSLTSTISEYPSETRLAVMGAKIKETWKSRQAKGINSILDSFSKTVSLDISIIDIIKTIISFGVIKP